MLIVGIVTATETGAAEVIVTAPVTGPPPPADCGMPVVADAGEGAMKVSSSAVPMIIPAPVRVGVMRG